ncbi:MAG: metal ABC transporter permease [Alistipes sp.]|nr:metal ABC transporter permease [Candidatus Alistipes equi]
MQFLSDIFSYGYLFNAVFSALMLGVVCGIVGTYVVARRMVFLTGGITHASFGGMGIAFFLGFNPLVGALFMAVLSSITVEVFSSRMKIREDSAIGIIWGVGMALGALFMSLRPGYTSGDMSSFLFGSILGLTSTDALLILLLMSCLILGAIFFGRRVMYAIFDSEFARSAGVRVMPLSLVMSIVIALTIVLSINMMGIVLLISLMTIPVVVADAVVKSYRAIMCIASLVGSLSCLLGLVLSYYLEVPSGPSIVFVMVSILVLEKLVLMWLKKRTLRAR